MSSNEMLDAYVTAVEGTPVENDTYQMVWNSNTGSQELERVSSGTYDLVFTIEGTIQIPSPANWAARKSGWANPTL